MEGNKRENPPGPHLKKAGGDAGHGLCRRYRRAAGGSGFTLMELILATSLSALVIGILSVCFSFAMRVWEVTQNQKPDHTFLLVDLLKRQLAECDPTPIKFSDNKSHPLFSAQPNSIAFVTAHSVKAISQGVPVVARYTYDPNSKMLSYSELLLDPYHPALIEKFLAGGTFGRKETAIPSYGVYFPEFELAYAGGDAKQFTQAWEKANEFPAEILLMWRANDSTVHAQVCMVNSPIPVEVQQSQPSPPASGLGNMAQ